MQGLDIETVGLDPEAPEARIRLVQIRDAKHGRVYDGHDPEVPEALLAVEAEGGVAHKATFERSWISRHFGIDLENLDDTMIMSQVYYTGTRAAISKSFSHSLQAVVKRELKRELSKDEQVSDWGAAALTREQLEYAAKDAAVLPQLAATLMRKIERAGLKRVYELERRGSYAIDAMQRHGVAIHTYQLDTMTEEATKKAERLKAELAEEWGINPGSSKQLIEHFKLERRQKWPQTAGGKPKTDQEAMKRLLSEEPSVAKWIEWKEIEKIRSTYGKSIMEKLDEDRRLRTRFKPFGTATGRFSSRGLGYAAFALCT